MDNKHASLAVAIILAFAAHSYIVNCESKALLVALEQTEAGYREFMSRSTGGKKLYEYINPNTVGVFRIEDKNYACGQINTPLPVLRRKK